MGSYLTAFLVGGLFCIIGQLIFDLTRLTPAHILVIFVIAGGVLSGIGLYEPILQFSGAGAMIPIASFGNSLVQGAMYEAMKNGLVGVLTGMFEMTSSGITAAIIFAFVMALIFNPKESY